MCFWEWSIDMHGVGRCFGVYGVWTFWVGQPAGLPEGSRRSPGVMGAATSGQRRRRSPAPRAECQTRRCEDCGPGGCCGHVSQVLAPRRGARPSDAVFRWSFPLCPERPPATLYQPCGLGSASKFRGKCPNSRGRTESRSPTRRAATALIAPRHLDSTGRARPVPAWGKRACGPEGCD